MINLNGLKKVAYNTAKTRKQDVTRFGTLKHMSGEVSELVFADASDTDIASELADVIICCLTYAHLKDINVEKEIKKKMEYNKTRV